MLKDIDKYIDKEGKFNFSKSPSEIFVDAFKETELLDKSKELSAYTIRAYNEDLNTFINFITKEENKDLKEINILTVKSYHMYLNQHFSARTARRKLSVLKRLLIFGYKTEFYSYSMSEWIKNPKIPKYNYSSKNNQTRQELRELDLETAKILISALDKTVLTKRKEREPLKARNRLLGFFLLTTGMRAREVISLRWSDIIHKPEGIFVIFKGKGNKQRAIPLTPPLLRELQTYRDALTEYSSCSSSYQNDINPIFISFTRNVNEQMSYDSLYKTIKKAVQYVSANKHISPHWFRHTFVTQLLEQDTPLAIVKELAGHEDISTTNLYLERMSNKSLTTAVQKVDFGLD